MSDPIEFRTLLQAARADGWDAAVNTLLFEKDWESGLRKNPFREQLSRFCNQPEKPLCDGCNGMTDGLWSKPQPCVCECHEGVENE